MTRRALVTGGSGGIGQAICRAFASNGIDVIVHANARLEAAQAIAEECAATDVAASAVAFDLADDTACATALNKLLASGAIDIVVHNAGIHDDAPMAGLDAARWQRVVDVNLNGFHRVVQPCMLPMARQRWGRVIAISSVAATLGNRGQAAYAAAKAGLHGAVYSIMREMASRKITANVVAPGIIDTGMAEDQFSSQLIKQLVPAARPGTAEEVATLVAFLASEDAAYVNGQVIGVDGGMSCG